MTGGANRGTWELHDTSSMNGPGSFQLSFHRLDGWIAGLLLRVVAPTKLLLGDRNVRYVPTDVRVLPPPASNATGCDAPEIENVPTPDMATTRQLLIGTWLLCDSPSFFGTTDEMGLVIGADGHWAKLVLDQAGNPVEMTGGANRGTWELLDITPDGRPALFQINFTGEDGTRGSSVFFLAPGKLRLDENGITFARYVRYGESAAPTPHHVSPGGPQLVATR
jgi:hypothetical protein